MILADTSIWVEHLNVGVPELAHFLGMGTLLIHPFIVGELACGTLRNRSEVLERLDALPAAAVATNAEVLGFITRHALMGRGIGYIDVHLLASASLGHTILLWTRDRRLAAVATDLHLAFGA